MSVQTAVSQYHKVGYAGDVYGDFRTMRTTDSRNNTSVDMIYGVMVADDSGGSGGTSRAIRPIAASTDTLKGILLRQHYHAPGIDGFGVSGIRPSGQAPILTSGRAIVVTEGPVVTTDSVYVRWGAGSASGNTAVWVASTAYTLSQRRTNGGLIYEVITPGTSASSGGPTGIGQDITDGTAHWKYVGVGITLDLPGAFRKDADVVTAWVGSTAFTVGLRRANDSGKVYEVITSGTSASSGGPTGTSSDITDGTVHWKYVGTCDPSTRATAILVSNAKWRVGTLELDSLSPSGLAVVELNIP
jgi:hypothetical protein